MVFPKVSIVTLNLNGDQYLENAIQSVLKQSYPNIEYIILDGGSTDHSIAIIKKYEKHIHAWMSEPDHGISSAYNKGIRMSSGEIIGLLNSDDWYEPDAVQIAVEVFEKNPNADVICGGLQNWVLEAKEMFLQPDQNLSKLNYEMILNHPSIFIKKTAYQKYGLFDEHYQYAMDYELFLRFYKKGAQFICFNNHLANMRLGGKSGQYWFRANQEMLKSQLKYLNPRCLPYLRYFYRIFRTTSRIVLQKFGLNAMVVFIRNLQSRKHYSF